jgi:diguanylate cyclase (GGDEF)-like protein/PAS domain S-box-containing protein
LSQNVRPFPRSAAGNPSSGLRRLEALVRAIDGIVWEADAATFCFTFVSGQAERLLGYAAGEWLAPGFWAAHIHPDDRDAAVDFCTEKSRGGMDHVFDYRMLAADGREVWLRDSVNVELRDGAPATLRGIMVDITTQKRTQQAIAEQFHFLWQLADSIPCPIYWKDTDGRYGGCNRAFEAYLGVPRGTLIGKTVYEVAPPDLARIYEKADRDLFRDGGTQVYEGQVRYADGSRHDVTFYKAVFTRESGAIGGLVGVMIDVTDRNRLGRELTQQTALLRTVIDAMPSGITMVDGNLDIVLANDRALAVMDLPRGLLNQGPVPLEMMFRYNAERGEYGPGDPDEQVRTRMSRARRQEAHHFDRVRPDGTAVEVKGEPLPGGGFVTIYSDITEARQARAELSRESALLRSVVEHMPQGISVFDESLVLRHWNQGFIDVLDLPAQMVYEGARFDDLIRIPATRGEYGPGDPEQHVRRIHDLAMQFQPHQFERVRPNGRTHLVCGRPLIIDGQVRGFITTYTDISERKTSEEALRLSSTVFERSAEGIILTDAEARILRVNAAFTRITGYAEDEVIGQTPRLLNSGAQDADFYGTMWRTLRERGHWSGEVVNRKRCGGLYTEHLSITRIDSGAGEADGYIGIFTDVTEAREAEQKIERLSYFDALTGLPNRALLMIRIEATIARAARAGAQFALLTVDIDRLSHINDTLGHQYGDKVLLTTAQRLAGSASDGEMVSRHAGDGFAVIVEDIADDSVARRQVERLLEAIQAPMLLDEHPLQVEAHIGIALYPGDGHDAPTLLKHADAALHHVRNEGVERYEFFRAEMNALAMERLMIESRLRQAIEREEFVLHFQPQIDLALGRVVGLEALVRWSHPEMGLVSPAKFIPIAESTGQILDLGCWVMREACRASRRLCEAGFPQLKMAVNVSARQFNQEDFAERVRRALRLADLPPDNLELELTESLILQRPEHVIRTMKALKETGVTFSIDDFGTGYSSLSQLKRYPIDKLKIDQSFIRDIHVDDDDAAITGAIIALGRSLRLKVVAEGVETDAQRAFLVEGGCHALQGYLISKPLPFDELLAFLRLQHHGG